MEGVPPRPARGGTPSWPAARWSPAPSGPAVVLRGGILLTWAANLDQAQPTAWGRMVAAVPPAAFLVAVSMIERRAARRPRPAAGQDGGIAEPSAPGRPSPVQDAGDGA